MFAYLPLANADLSTLGAEALAELQSLAAEAMGWQPLGEGAYLHHGNKDYTVTESMIQVVGIPDTPLAGLNALLLT